MIGAAELLLQERIPRDVAVARPRPEEVKSARHVREIVPPVIRRFRTPHTRVPRTHVLSNGRYSVMVTNAGSGYSRHLDRAVTRWREDTTRDGWGQWLYLRDTTSGEVWSAGYQPTAAEPEHYEALFSEDRAEIHRLDNAIWTSLEVIVAPEDDGELRRLTIKNLGARPREIEVTSYAELVLAPAAADDAHPAFQNLFVQTEFVPALDAILATRRPREGDDPEVWAAHVVAVAGGETVGTLQCETDRARFLGRGRGPRDPIALRTDGALSGTTGAVLDPIFALRTRVRLAPGESESVAFTTLVATTRQRAFELADRYHDAYAARRALDLAWTSQQVELRELGLTAADAAVFQELAGHLLYSNPHIRAPEAELRRNRGSQPLLWAQGVNNYNSKDENEKKLGLKKFREAHDEFVHTLERNPDGKYTKDAAYAQMLAMKNALEYDETGGLDVDALEAARGPMTAGRVAGMRLHGGLSVTTSLDPTAEPFLDHHRIDGTPVLPGGRPLQETANAERAPRLRGGYRSLQ